MNPTVVSTPDRLTGHLRWTLTESFVMWHRNLISWVRVPIQMAYSLFWPVEMVVLFGFVFGGAMAVDGVDNYREYLMPGLFGQTMLFGIVTTLMTVANDSSKGVTDRLRSMPISRSSVVLGHCFTGMFHSFLELVSLILCGLAIGWRWHNGWESAVLAVLLLLLLRYSLIWVGIYIGLRLSPEAAGSSFVVLFPVSLLANTFVSPEQMPTWLRVMSEWNPLSATIGASAELFGNPGRTGGSWAADHATLLAIVWPLVITAVFLPLAVRRWRNLSR
ncbi:ABC transporter permease [Micromonospora aurantiaca (nom. illeg.)]|uniref:ABC transporter permease n=1 Tax=Micromonospora aurantiaca (nom. illeg.) TaxID=47850 RepID=UPI000F3FE853|nr:ABC transporter permease [Micromonospora aurantiaca]RNI07099.1 ABC transporter permease [Micromonospora aurantiaca]